MKSNFNEQNQGQMPGTTVVQKFNQGTLPPLGGFKRRGPFFGTFLGKQKSTELLSGSRNANDKY
jgi:hypothetical protein